MMLFGWQGALTIAGDRPRAIKAGEGGDFGFVVADETIS